MKLEDVLPEMRRGLPAIHSGKVYALDREIPWAGTKISGQEFAIYQMLGATSRVYCHIPLDGWVSCKELFEMVNSPHVVKADDVAKAFGLSHDNANTVIGRLLWAHKERA